MKHPSVRQLFEYWDARRSTFLPECGDIRPSEIRSVLADTLMLSSTCRGAYRFCAAGTRVCALLGRELKGAAFLDLWSAASRDEVLKLLDVIIAESIGAVASADARCSGKAGIRLELLLLPLAMGGRTDTRLLGALVPAAGSEWQGKRRPDRLNLGLPRYLGEIATIRREVRPSRPVLVVYEGGLSR
jgi:hypothetical protein